MCICVRVCAYVIKVHVYVCMGMCAYVCKGMCAYVYGYLCICVKGVCICV